jgi:Spy/CpxP family protein refolding chaperone
MKMKKIVLTVMAVFIVAAVATTVFAFGCGRGPGYGPCAQGDFQGPAGLNLTAEQAAKIKEMRETQWKEMKPLREQMFGKRDEIRKLWLEPNPDQGKITSAQKEMSLLRDQMQDRMTAFRLEEKEKMGSFIQGRGPGHGRGFGPKGPGGAGCFGGSPDFCTNK